MLRVWRLVTARYASTAFSSDGARIYRVPERKGVPLVYTTGSQPLAVLETLVQDQPLRARYLMIPAVLRKYTKIERVVPEGT